jgi:hypothetical protein
VPSLRLKNKRKKKRSRAVTKQLRATYHAEQSPDTPRAYRGLLELLAFGRSTRED